MLASTRTHRKTTDETAEVMAWFRRTEQEHRHQWVSVACDNEYEVRFIGGDGLPGRRHVTLILQRCRCGAHNTDSIDGSWSREELGIDDRTIADLLALLNEIDRDDETH